MEIEDILSGGEQADVAQRLSRRQLTQQAITTAVQSRWQEAVDLNRQIVELAPTDAEAFNRLGKAYTELGEISEARRAYEQAIEADPANLIAQCNLERLSHISDSEAEELRRKATDKLDPRFFMEETGKTRVTVLTNPAKQEVLATLTAGDRVVLAPDDGQVVVQAVDETRIGLVEESLAARLIRLMQTGNQYQAGVVGVDRGQVRIIIRETLQSPQNSGRISFPPQKAAEMPRPYLREGLVRRTGDEEDDDELDVDLQDETADDDEEDASEFGFHESNLDESEH